MKRCPTCNRVETDDALKFCRVDGATLVDSLWLGNESGTAQLGSSPNASEVHTSILSNKTDAVMGRATGPITALPFQMPPATTGAVAKSRSRNSIVIALVVFALLATVTATVVISYRTRIGGAAIDSIAVLPFNNQNNDAEAEYLSDGLAESLNYRLSQLPNLKVSPTSSVIRYKGKQTDVKAIAGELGVSSVLTGRILKRGDSLMISVELVDVRNNKLLWGEQYDRKMADLLATQREIAVAITQKLQLKLAGDEKGITKKYTNNNDAYQLYLKGRYHFARRTKDDVAKAIESFEQAIKLDPNSALAYARIAEAYNQMPNYPYASPREAFPKAKAAAERAIAIDPTLSEAHTAMGNTLTSFDWNWTEAEKSFNRALELDPNSATAHYRFATEYLVSVGRTKEAASEVEKALEIEPLDPNMVANLSRAYLYNGERERALEQSRRAYEADPGFVIARLIYGLTLNAMGMYTEAIALSEKGLQNDPTNQHMLLVAGYAYGRSGRREKANAIIEKFREISRTQYVIPSFIAAVYGAKGEKEKAFAELEKSIELRDSWFKWGKVEPLFDPLRDEPRFKDLLRRMNLPE